MSNNEEPSMKEIHDVLKRLRVPYTEEQARAILTKWGSQLTQFGLRQGARRSDAIVGIFLDQMAAREEEEELP